MSTPNPSTAPTNGRPATESVPPNGQSGAAQAVPAAAAPSGKKGKAKKMPEPSEASKLIAQRISQLEMDAALDKDQEAELEREVRKANRELQNQTAKMMDMQKIEFLTKRCSDLFMEMKRHERESIKNKKRTDQLQKDKDNSRQELNKTVSLKEKLEKLCRELQKENNKLKVLSHDSTDGMGKKQDADEFYVGRTRTKLLQMRKFGARLRGTSGIQAFCVEWMNIKKTKITHRFKSLIDQYELRELHFHSQMRTKELEVQYNLARYEQQKKNYEAEYARSRQLNAQVQAFTQTEADLRHQLSVYVEKFKQVEDTLNNSNDLFTTFRKEMEDMTKKTKRLEKENEQLKRKHEQVNGNILKMAEERNRNLSEIEELRKKLDKLNGIIKQMQQQGRGIPQGMASGTNAGTNASNGTSSNSNAAATQNGHHGGHSHGSSHGSHAENGHGEEEGDGSEYDEDEYDEGEEEGSEEGEFDDETEDELHQQGPQQPQPYGPERPLRAAPAAAATTNGHR
ncbi:uncharacterized protein CTHT_0066270 [Thermochaetoides thermophila DSM 1495]|uniref:Alpha-taxilin-like protein n=1 Tax=Chaetomium thermophilum (strain DSM 1495 / CBS 144.50 / IMI 039719) TaxID=759272 RepID=G0SGG7_CHATD|nr:hypothetical protein CTHT_0066270 [Thermochaetoides thermophila DSM 1495]EGS17306.1 hypothetical protein CTHT_0066270 [Thermochaetoides thermophila DSM 1495]